MATGKPAPADLPGAMDLSDFSGPLRGSGSRLETATLAALDNLHDVLTLQPVSADRFQAINEPRRFGRIFGGQLIAQAMTAAAATVDDLSAHSIHASFLRAGDSSIPLDITVDRTRDGRSMSVRQVVVAQSGRTLMAATVSFDRLADGDDLDDPISTTTGTAFSENPEELPLLQHWASQAPVRLGGRGRAWIDTPPPLEMRTAEAPGFLGGPQSPQKRGHWIRLPANIEGPPQLHTVLLAYASDYLLVDTAFRSHPQRVDYVTHLGLTLDHSVWVHRPIQFDRWHLYTQHTVATVGHRALVNGSIVDITGRHVASTAQEVLVRPIAQPGRAGESVICGI